MKRYILKKGDVLELTLAEKGFGYVRAIEKDEFGVMFEIYGKTFENAIDESTFDQTSLPIKAIAYVNPYGARMRWRLRFRNKLGIEEMPKSFYGSPDERWFVREGKPIKKISQWFEDGATIKKINPREVSYDQMLADGYIHKALWLPDNVEELLISGKPLRWNWDKART